MSMTPLAQAMHDFPFKFDAALKDYRIAWMTEYQASWLPLYQADPVGTSNADPLTYVPWAKENGLAFITLTNLNVDVEQMKKVFDFLTPTQPLWKPAQVLSVIQVVLLGQNVPLPKDTNTQKIVALYQQITTKHKILVQAMPFQADLVWQMKNASILAEMSQVAFSLSALQVTTIVVAMRTITPQKIFTPSEMLSLMRKVASGSDVPLEISVPKRVIEFLKQVLNSIGYSPEISVLISRREALRSQEYDAMKQLIDAKAKREEAMNVVQMQGVTPYTQQLANSAYDAMMACEKTLSQIRDQILETNSFLNVLYQRPVSNLVVFGFLLDRLPSDYPGLTSLKTEYAVKKEMVIQRQTMLALYDATMPDLLYQKDMAYKMGDAKALFVIEIKRMWFEKFKEFLAYSSPSLFPSSMESAYRSDPKLAFYYAPVPQMSFTPIDQVINPVATSSSGSGSVTSAPAAAG